MASRSSNYDAGYDPKLGYNPNAFDNRPIPLKAIGSVVRGIGSGIGIVSEAIHHQIDKKHERSQASSSNTPKQTTDSAPGEAVPNQQQQHDDYDDDDEDDPLDTNDADWALDEALSSSDEETQATFTNADDGAIAPQSTHLPHPVILPQRRPGTKTRGFVRAYAPVLSTHVAPPMPPDDFAGFLGALHDAAQASPVFDVVLLASAVGGLYPGVVAMAVSTAVQIVAKVGQEVQERWQVNRFLEKANREVWAPRGLFAMIVAYRPDLEGQVGSEVVDMSATGVVKYGGSSGLTAEGDGGKGRLGEMREKMKRLRVASGRSRGETEMPIECAQLIFPEVDKAAEKAVVEEEKKGGEVTMAGVVDTFKGKTKDAGNWVNDYLDRRAAMEFAYKHPNAALASLAPPPKPFKSKFADPNAAVNKHLITMITGGRIKAEPLGARRRWERAQRRGQRETVISKLVKPAKRILQEDVLYLMIVNMPSEGELAEARRKIAETKQAKSKKSED
ncbi:hypothetical protein B0J12DRAFT_737062 [Macrophomina phaseolina]|uniref:Uncharacterized protein n=1 Tax=Macrophomina phaseolina TaxID=35725 RepID=A0ABQ8GM78_9PEZI|nr:hypothetical protein B0J12DRAFT_737062 [Macrophomina phaseolina]